MNRICVCAVRCKNIIIYRYDLPVDILKSFISSNKPYMESPESKKGNIFVDQNIILQEWDKYKVKSLIGDFTINDFSLVGEFGSEDYGTLLFKNCIGFAKFKGITIIVESAKISKNEMEVLIHKINSHIANLSYSYNQSTFSAVERDHKNRTDIGYHIFLMIHNALSTNDKKLNVFNNFKLIENNPCRTLTSNISYEDISTVDEITVDALQDIFSGGCNLIEYKGNKIRLAEKIKNGSRKFIPEVILKEEAIYTFDNRENQFIKYVLVKFLKVITMFQKKFLNETEFRNIELLEENENNIRKLNYILKQSFLKEVGELQNIPMNSTVLTMRDGYRQLFALFLGINSMPISDTSNDIKEMIENKSLDVLYENYCYFELSDVIASIYGEKLSKKKYKVSMDEFSKKLEKKTGSNYFEFERTLKLPLIKVHYNKNYVAESYSKAYDPDITVEIYDTNNILKAIYAFDAKFKINLYDTVDDGDEIRSFKYDDISKMHTYRDAIKLAKGAYVLYPGDVNKIYYANENKDPKLLYGVGAFSLSVGNKMNAIDIKEHLRCLLEKYKELGC